MCLDAEIGRLGVEVVGLRLGSSSQYEGPMRGGKC
jgi:hypothetical protein